MIIDNSKQGLKCVLLYGGNLIGVVLVGHSVCFREEYRDVRIVMSYCDIIDTGGSSVLTLRWCSSFLVSNVDTQTIPAFPECGIAELGRSIGLRLIGL